MYININSYNFYTVRYIILLSYHYFLGNFRIPKTMLTNPDGTKIDAQTKYPHKGIVRGTRDTSQCTFIDAWRMYKCTDINYKMFVLESLDADTETRRLSPLALASQGYIDLINGPQDHGWCHGYTCQERISTFQTVVATGNAYEVYFTSFNPQKMRLTLLNAEDTDIIRMQIYYPKPERLDIYRNGRFTF